MGRFINEDTVEGQINNPLTLNVYTYCANNPIMFLDPSGNTYIIAWSYGKNDVKAFEQYLICGFTEGIIVDGDTSEWTDEIWQEFDQKSSFARAAYTRKRDLMEAGVSESEIVVQRIDNKEDLADAWDVWAEYDVVDGLDFYSHGYSGGAEVYRGSGDFWSNAGKLNWDGDSPYAAFYGCNTANGKFAQDFANTQGIVTYGQTNYSNFSSRKNRYSAITTHGTTLGVYMGVFNRFLFIFKTSLVPMKKFTPQ